MVHDGNTNKVRASKRSHAVITWVMKLSKQQEWNVAEARLATEGLWLNVCIAPCQTDLSIANNN